MGPVGGLARVKTQSEFVPGETVQYREFVSV